MRPSNIELRNNQRVQDASGNKGRILNSKLRDGMVRVRMDYGFNRDYQIDSLTTITPKQ